MQLTITEATKILSAMEKFAGALQAEPTTAIGFANDWEVDVLQNLLDEKARETGKRWFDFSNLIQVTETLSKRITKAKADLGIEEILAEEASHRNRASYLRIIVDAGHALDAASLKEQIEATKSSVDTPALSENVLKAYADKLVYAEQRRSELENRRRMLCMTNKIDLEDEQFTLLKAFKIV